MSLSIYSLSLLTSYPLSLSPSSLLTWYIFPPLSWSFLLSLSSIWYITLPNAFSLFKVCTTFFLFSSLFILVYCFIYLSLFLSLQSGIILVHPFPSLSSTCFLILHLCLFSSSCLISFPPIWHITLSLSFCPFPYFPSWYIISSLSFSLSST